MPLDVFIEDRSADFTNQWIVGGGSINAKEGLELHGSKLPIALLRQMNAIDRERSGGPRKQFARGRKEINEGHFFSLGNLSHRLGVK